jgi:hypothetical protein
VGKRRTRKQKEEARHQFNISWTPQPQKGSSEANVKGQIKTQPESRHDRGQKPKSAKLLAKEGNFEAYQRDIVKSLILASIILAAELVLYLAWK